MEQDIQRAAKRISETRNLLVITGAGISAESGIPTFRNPGGLWNKIDPTKVATPEAFNANPLFVWQWYNERRVNLSDKKPNPGHDRLARLEKKVSHFFLLTQNVDDLHEQAGSVNLAHIHGEIWKVRCTQCHTIREDRRVPLPELPPKCPACGGLERPNVVWFGEAINQHAAMQTDLFLSNYPADTIMVIGTEASFPYILHWARASKGTIIEINLAETSLTPHADIFLQGKAGEILPAVCQDIFA